MTTDNAILWRVVWKEYRGQRAFWLAIALFAVVLMLLVMMEAAIDDQPTPVYALFTVALFMPVFYALGSGATLFAAEHESETYEFQRTLPVSAGRLLSGKLGFALASVVVLPPTLWLVALVFAGGELPRADMHLAIWLGGIITLMEVFAWAVFFSLLLGRVLWSVVLAAVGPCLFAFVLLPRLCLFVPMGTLGGSINEYMAVLPVRVLVAIVVLAVDIWLGRRWLREYPMPWSRPRVSSRQMASTSDRGKAMRASRGLVLGRLVWQSWRQSQTSIWLILGGLALISAYVIAFEARNEGGALSLPLAMFPLAACLLGCCVYWADQRKQQFRFFAERGIEPRTVWFSRQIVWICAAFVWLVVSIVCMGIEMSRSSSMFRLEPVVAAYNPSMFVGFQMRREAIDMALAMLGLGVLSYSVSQACSLFLRSGILALAVGLFCSVNVGVWAGAMWRLQVPLWFAVAPIPLIALWASWLRAPDWLSERTRWRARFKLVFSLVLPLAAVLAATACFRAYEVPVVQLNLPEANPSQPSSDARKTLQFYHEAWSASESKATEEVAIAKFIEASRREHCWFPNSYDLHRKPHASTVLADVKKAEILVSHPGRLAAYVLDSGDSLESEGKFEEAFERYLAVLRFVRHLYDRGDLNRQSDADAVEAITLDRLPKWAARPGQSAETIRRALQRLDREYFVFSPPREYETLDDFLLHRDILDFDEAAWEMSGAERKERAVFRCLSVVLPCEHARAKRVWDACMASQLQRIRSTRRLLATNGCVQDAVDPFYERNLQWLRTTPLLWWNPHLLPVYDDWRLDLMAAHEGHRRIARLQLALAAWRAEHGELPEALDELVGKELSSLPVDPFTGRPFRYRPEGIPWPVRGRDVSSLGELSEDLAAGTPLLWCAGPNLIYFRRGGQGEPAVMDYQYKPPHGTVMVLHSEQEVWAHGWCFPIP